MKKKTPKKKPQKVKNISKTDMLDMMDEHRKLKSDVRALRNTIERQNEKLQYEIRVCSGSVGVFKSLLNEFIDSGKAERKTFSDLMKDFADHVKKNPSVFNGS